MKFLHFEFFFFSNLPVLDPRLKLQYYITHGWETEWIKEAKTAVYTTYDETYAPLPGSISVSESGSGSGSGSGSVMNTKLSDIDTALQQHIFYKNKKQKLTENPAHEVDIYLNSKIVETDTLTWWHVS
jgi:hypothetical protein